MRDAEKTIGHMTDKLKIAFLGSVDEEGFPNVTAMSPPRKRNGIKNAERERLWIRRNQEKNILNYGGNEL